jgi:hypothetical protein
MCAELAIPPVEECYGQPTCAVDTHVMDHFFTEQVTGFQPLNLPVSLGYEKFCMNSSFRSDDKLALYAGHVEVRDAVWFCVMLCCAL